MLPAINRLRSSKDFVRTTKTGLRATTPSLVLYTLTHSDFPMDSRVGLIINSSVGGSVTRHRIARKLRHTLRDHLGKLPHQSMIVVRVLRNSEDYAYDLIRAINTTHTKLSNNEKVSQ